MRIVLCVHINRCCGSRLKVANRGCIALVVLCRGQSPALLTSTVSDFVAAATGGQDVNRGNLELIEAALEEEVNQMHLKLPVNARQQRNLAELVAIRREAVNHL